MVHGREPMHPSSVKNVKQLFIPIPLTSALLFEKQSSQVQQPVAMRLCVLNNGGLETLGVLDVDGLDVGVELLLGALLVVTLARDADAEAERNTLNTTLPDLLVQLGVEADVASALDGGRTSQLLRL